MNEVAINKANNHLGHLWLRLEGITKPYLYIFVIAKSAGDSKDYCRDGHDGQQGRVCECRCLLHHTLSGEEAYGKYEFLCNFQEEELQWRHIVLIDSPDIRLKELDNSIYPSTHDILSS